MKRTLLLSIFSLSVFAAGAQITITSADVAVPTKVILQANDTLHTTISVGSAGASQTWNMATLNNHFEDTLTFLPYSAAPNPKFAGSNLIVKQGWQNFYTYLNNSSTSLTVLGNGGVTNFGGGPSQVNQIDSPSEKLLNFSTMYGSTFTNNYTQRATFYYGTDPGIGIVIDSLRTKSVVKKTSLTDAWGTLSTPLGTYSVLRVKETVIKHDTTDAFIGAFGGWQSAIANSADSAVNFTWWANGVGFPLVSIKLDSTGAISSAKWLEALPMTVGVNEYTAAVNVNVYPNPAQNNVNIAIDPAAVSSIQIFDVTGRMVGTHAVSSDVTSVNTGEYANGIYSFRAIGRNNAILTQGKFTIAR